MSWTCRFLEKKPDEPSEIQIGDMWYANHLIDDLDLLVTYEEQFFSVEYKRDWMGKRPPIFVKLPGGAHFSPDFRATNPAHGESGWVVTGNPPNITVSPSINAIGMYHGFLQNGILSDDVEGRKFQ